MRSVLFWLHAGLAIALISSCSPSPAVRSVELPAWADTVGFSLHSAFLVDLGTDSLALLWSSAYPVNPEKADPAWASRTYVAFGNPVTGNWSHPSLLPLGDRKLIRARSTSEGLCLLAEPGSMVLTLRPGLPTVETVVPEPPGQVVEASDLALLGKQPCVVRLLFAPGDHSRRIDVTSWNGEQSSIPVHGPTREREWNKLLATSGENGIAAFLIHQNMEPTSTVDDRTSQLFQVESSESLRILAGPTVSPDEIADAFGSPGSVDYITSAPLVALKRWAGEIPQWVATVDPYAAAGVTLPAVSVRMAPYGSQYLVLWTSWSPSNQIEELLQPFQRPGSETLHLRSIAKDGSGKTTIDRRALVPGKADIQCIDMVGIGEKAYLLVAWRPESASRKPYPDLRLSLGVLGH